MSKQVFKDRRAAGRALAERFVQGVDLDDAIVLALPRGGVPVAFEVAKALQLPLDVLIVRKLGIPGHEEFAMGAITTAGIEFLDQQLIQELHIKPEAIANVRAAQTKELQRREHVYRDDRPLPQLQGRTVFLIDDGLATGATMRVAVAAVRKQGARKIILAVPVAPKDTLEKFIPLVDEIVCLATPQPFSAVGQWYENFNQTRDEEVHQLLSSAWRRA